MSDARDEQSKARHAILSSIRSSLAAGSNETERQRSVQARLAAPARNLTPQRALEDRETLFARFCKSLRGEGADVVELSAAEIPRAVCDYLTEHQLPLRLRMGEDEFLNELAWDTGPSALSIRHGASDGEDLVTISRAFGAAAETGSLFLLSGKDNPTTLNFLADTHIVVVEKEKILGPYEAVWDRIREAFGDRLPRVVNIIGGPSRTADIEQTLVRGAHGPRQMLVLVVDAQQPS